MFNFDLDLVFTNILISTSMLMFLVVSPADIPPPLYIMLPPHFLFLDIPGERMIATLPFMPWQGCNSGHDESS